MPFQTRPASKGDVRDIAAVAIQARFHNAFERSTYPHIYGGLSADDTSIAKEHSEELVAIRTAELCTAMEGGHFVHFVAERQGGETAGHAMEIVGFEAYETKRKGIPPSAWDVLLAREYLEEIRRDYWRIMMPQYKHVLGERPHMRKAPHAVCAPQCTGSRYRTRALTKVVLDVADRQQLELFVEATPPGKLMHVKKRYGFVVKGESCLDMRKYGQLEPEYRNYLMMRQPREPVGEV